MAELNTNEIPAALEAYYEAIHMREYDRASTEWRRIASFSHLIDDEFERELFLSMPHRRRA